MVRIRDGEPLSHKSTTIALEVDDGTPERQQEQAEGPWIDSTGEDLTSFEDEEPEIIAGDGDGDSDGDECGDGDG